MGETPKRKDRVLLICPQSAGLDRIVNTTMPTSGDTVVSAVSTHIQSPHNALTVWLNPPSASLRLRHRRGPRRLHQSPSQGDPVKTPQNSFLGRSDQMGGSEMGVRLTEAKVVAVGLPQRRTGGSHSPSGMLMTSAPKKAIPTRSRGLIQYRVLPITIHRIWYFSLTLSLSPPYQLP